MAAGGTPNASGDPPVPAKVAFGYPPPGLVVVVVGGRVVVVVAGGRVVVVVAGARLVVVVAGGSVDGGVVVSVVVGPVTTVSTVPL